MDVERLQHLALDLVDEVVAGQGVLLALISTWTEAKHWPGP